MKLAWLAAIAVVLFCLSVILLANLSHGQDAPKLNCAPEFFFNGWEIVKVWELAAIFTGGGKEPRPQRRNPKGQGFTESCRQNS